MCSSIARRALFLEKPELQRELHVLRPVREAELLGDALLVGIHRLRADEKLLADLRRGVARRDEPQHVAFPIGELLELRALVGVFGTFPETAGEYTSGGGLNVRIPVRHSAHRVDQLAIGGALLEESARA